MILSVPLHLLYDKVKFSLQYADYESNEWTAPVLLTEERAEKFCSDLSVVRVKIINGNQEFIFEMKN